MKLQKNKSIATIALILMLTASAILASMSIANAQGPPVTNYPTNAYLVVIPNPVGVGQTATVEFWLDKVPPTAAGAQGDRWQNLTVTVTKPDGTTQTIGTTSSDPVGQAYLTFVPNVIGTYYFQFSFPGQQITGLGGQIPIPINNYYQPSTSQKVALAVQQQPIESFPAAFLPTGYWTNPIEGYNREWNTISGNWLSTNVGSPFGQTLYNNTGNFNPYTAAPNTAHIVWTKPIAAGGLMGGEFGSAGTSSYNWGNTYEPMFVPPVILNGVLYYNAPVAPREGYYAVNLRTGETLWWQNGTGPVAQMGGIGLNQYYGVPGITMGQIFNYISPNQYGGAPYLWFTKGTIWYMYDANTGNLILSVANATNIGNGQTPGTTVQGPNGELLVYLFANNQLFMWNSSLCIGTLGTTGTAAWCWRPIAGSVLNWYRGIQWNVSTPNMGPFQGISNTNGNVIITTTGNIFLPQSWQMEAGYSAIDGHLMWTQNRTTPAGATTFALMGPIGEGIYTEFHQSTTQWYGFNITTGVQIWGPSDPYTNAWGFYDSTGSIAYGKLYATGYDGIIHCFDVMTGTHLWDWDSGSSGYETAYGRWPLSVVGSITIADGKIYVGSAHGLVQPMFRGAQLYCIDANSGQELWSVNSWTGSTIAVSDGYLVTLNGYDNQIDCYGKGLTATSVSAPATAQPQGTTVLIQGTVTDRSPGQTCLGMPAAGTAAVSDDSMSSWMEYLYMQEPMPNNATGVPVTLSVFDPNNNTYIIGTTTSDTTGGYGYMWTPPVPGLYTITATFAGSKSYYASSSETHLVVVPQASAKPQASATQISPTTPPSTTPPPITTPPASLSPTPSPSVAPPPTGQAPTMTYVAIAVAVIVIIIAAAAITLRRRK